MYFSKGTKGLLVDRHLKNKKYLISYLCTKISCDSTIIHAEGTTLKKGILDVPPMLYFPCSPMSQYEINLEK